MNSVILDEGGVVAAVYSGVVSGFIPCDDNVKVGWVYSDGVFNPPEVNAIKLREELHKRINVERESRFKNMIVSVNGNNFDANPEAQANLTTQLDIFNIQTIIDPNFSDFNVEWITSEYSSILISREDIYQIILLGAKKKGDIYHAAAVMKVMVSISDVDDIVNFDPAVGSDVIGFWPE